MNKTMRKAIASGRQGTPAEAVYSAATGRFERTDADLCIACNGSGYYDDTDSPTCGSCNGTGLNNKVHHA